MNQGKKLPENENPGDDQLWELLGHARPTKVSPFFARKVVRAVKELDSAPSPWLALWRRLTRPVAVLSFALALVAAFAAVVLFNQDKGPDTFVSQSSTAEVKVEVAEKLFDTFDFTQELQSIDRFGELMAVADPGELSDEAFMQLLF